MTTQLCAWAVAAACLLALPAAAQTAPTPSSTAPAGLYQALGEKPGITRLVDDFVNRAVKDPRIGSHFKDTKPQALKKSLTDQICQLSGGPCQYEGGDMKSAHADMDITKAHAFLFDGGAGLQQAGRCGRVGCAGVQHHHGLGHGLSVAA